MANGTLKVSNIQTSSGSGTITIGQSGETVALGSGASQTLAANTPAFEANLNANQYGVTRDVYTKITFQEEVFDTDNAYDNSSNYRFTPQTAGKYFVYSTQRVISTNNGQLRSAVLAIYKNGSAITYKATNFNMNNTAGRAMTPSVQAIVDMNGSSDYLEIFGLQYSNDNVNTSSGFNTGASIFGAYKIIGA